MEQLKHTDPPVVAMYFPETQLVHEVAPEDAPNLPTPHPVHADDPVVAYFPAGQMEQEVLPVFAW